MATSARTNDRNDRIIIPSGPVARWQPSARALVNPPEHAFRRADDAPDLISLSLAGSSSGHTLNDLLGQENVAHAEAVQKGANPRWNEAPVMLDWRPYVPAELRARWLVLSPSERVSAVTDAVRAVLEVSYDEFRVD